MLNDVSLYEKISNHVINNANIPKEKLDIFFKNFCFAFDNNNCEDKWNTVKQKQSKNKIYCDFCGSENHTSKFCQHEATYGPIYRLAIGKWAETFVSQLKCPKCKTNNLKELNDNSPSLDIICSACNQKIEVKSKCLSVNKLPNDIYLPHGNFIKYEERKTENLDFVIVIYGVNRKSKTFFVRKILYIPNKDLNNSKKISVVKNNNSSIIYIPNINIFNSLE